MRKSNSSHRYWIAALILVTVGLAACSQPAVREHPPAVRLEHVVPHDTALVAAADPAIVFNNLAQYWINHIDRVTRIDVAGEGFAAPGIGLEVCRAEVSRVPHLNLYTAAGGYQCYQYQGGENDP